MIDEAATVDLQQLQFPSAEVDRAETSHWMLSQVTTDDGPTWVTSAVNVRLVPVAVMVTFQVAPLPWQGLPFWIPTLTVIAPLG